MNNRLLGGRYELLEKIGEGGMSEVYKAKCTKLNRFVAVKILKKEFSENEDISKKFREEATAIAKLSESNIVNVLDVGHEEDLEYFVMEYIDGKTLKDIIKYHGRLSYQTSIKVGLQIAKGLDCAHRNNIIHRDVKPQNILVTENGEVKITDFGIAKNTTSSTITNTQTIVGSAHYFSPEQAKGSFIDCRTDVYSLGIVLYEMVTGVLPFDGESPVTIALKHIQEKAVSPKSLNAAVPESLNRIILKCMEKEVNLRYASMKELMVDLQKVQDNPDILINTETKNFDEDRTIIMPAINNEIDKNNAPKSLKDDYYDDDEEDEELEEYDEKPLVGISKKKRKAIIGSVVAVVVILLFGIGFYFIGGSQKPKEVKIPDIVNMSREEAKAKLEELNLVYRETHVDDTSEAPEGTILKVEPKVGTMVTEGTEIKVTVAAGIESFEMPSFKEQDKDYAIQWLKQKGITNPTVNEEFSEEFEAGKIISQEPATGEKITKNTSVTIVVSKGKETKYEKVPDLKNKTEAEARDILVKLGFDVSVRYTTVKDTTMDKVVIGVDNVGKELPEGATVSIEVGKFRINPNELINTSMSLGKAEEELAKKGIFIKVSNQNGNRNLDAMILEIDSTPVEIGGTVYVKTEELPDNQEDVNN